MIMDYDVPAEDPKLAKLTALLSDKKAQIEKLKDALDDRDTRL